VQALCLVFPSCGGGLSPLGWADGSERSPGCQRAAMAMQWCTSRSCLSGGEPSLKDITGLPIKSCLSEGSCPWLWTWSLLSSCPAVQLEPDSGLNSPELLPQRAPRTSRVSRGVWAWGSPVIVGSNGNLALRCHRAISCYSLRLWGRVQHRPCGVGLWLY